VKRIVRVVESKCDGCGLCIPACPEGAIKIVGGKAKVDESACDGAGACIGSCPKGALEVVEVVAAPLQSYAVPSGGSSRRGRNWPVKLELVHPRASFFDGSRVAVAADCAPFICASFYESIAEDRVLLACCPMLGDRELYRDKLTGIFKHNSVESVLVVYVDVPCCAVLAELVRDCLGRAGKSLPTRVFVVNLDGSLLTGEENG